MINVPQAEDHEDSGILAVLFAHMSSQLENPLLLSIDINSKALRNSLIGFLETGEWHYTICEALPTNKIITQLQFETYCICNKPSYDSLIKCFDCNTISPMVCQIR